jgi:hypothetical protein
MPDYVSTSFTGLNYTNTLGYDTPPAETSQHGRLSPTYDHIPTILELLEDAARSIGLPVPGTNFAASFPHVTSRSGVAVDGQWYDWTDRLVLLPASELWWEGRAWQLSITQLPVTPDNFGTIAGSLRPVTAAIAGLTANPVTGDIAGTLRAVTSNISGLSLTAVTGTLDGTLAVVTAALAGTHAQPPDNVGTVTGALQAVTGALSGDVVNNYITVTLPAVTAALSGISFTGGGITATLAATLPAVTGELVGEVPTVVTPAPRTGGGSLRRRFYSTTKASGTLSER